MLLRTLFIFLLQASLLLSGNVKAPPNPIDTERNDIVQQYPHTLKFRLKTRDTLNIQRLTLLYHTNGQTCAESVERQDIDVPDGELKQADWTLDLRYGATLPPGAVISWQWQIVDSAGQTTLTPEQTTVIKDANLNWKTLSRAGLFVHWANGPTSFGRNLLKIADAGLKRLTADLNIQPGRDIHIWVYPDSQTLRDTLIFGPDWTGGVALPEYASVMIGIEPAELTWARSSIPHELAHVLVEARTLNCFGTSLPTWLNEGLAVHAEQDASLHGERAKVIAALSSGQIGSLRSLAQGFQSDPQLASLSYAFSGQIVAFMVSQGADKMPVLFDRIQQGDSVDEALQTAYGFDTDGLDAAWRTSVGMHSADVATTATPTPKARTTRTPVPTFVLWTAVPPTPQP